LKGLIYIVVGGLLAGVSLADNYRFAVNGGNWMSGKKWQNETAKQDGWKLKEGLPLPDDDDTVRFNYGGAAGSLNADAGVIKQLQIGIDDLGGELTLDPGAKLVVSSGGNMVGYESTGALTVNGGTLSYMGELDIGYNGDGFFEINDGVVRVDSTFCHNNHDGYGLANSTLNGGLLDVNVMTLKSGILNVAGGVLRIRTCTKECIKRWINEGLLTFNGAISPKESDYILKPWGRTGFEIIVSSPDVG
jgi:hypothetical protein